MPATDPPEMGTALAAWLVASTTLTELARTGLIPAERAAEMIDNAALTLEQHRAALEAIQPLMFEGAHSKLRGLHQVLSRFRYETEPGGPAPPSAERA